MPDPEIQATFTARLLAKATEGTFEIIPMSAGTGNGWQIDAAVLQESLPLWENANSFVDHKLDGHSIRDLCGVITSPRWDEAGQGIIATGAGIPTHYLAEPESSTRTTAEATGTPAFKRFKSRQMYLKHVVQTVVSVALAIRRRTTSRIPAAPEFEIIVPDASERDNAQLAIGAQRIVAAFAPLYNARLIDSKELVRFVYRFIAEIPPARAGFMPASGVPGARAPGAENVPDKFIPINTRGGRKMPADPPTPDETAPAEDSATPPNP